MPGFLTTSGTTSSAGDTYILIFLPGFEMNLILWFCLYNKILQITKKKKKKGQDIFFC